MPQPTSAGQARVEATILESIADHVVRYDRAWRYVYVNPAAERLLGRTRDELLGRSIWELYPEAVGNQYYQEVHAALATQQVIRSEHYYAPFDRWFGNHFHPSADGVTVISTDITAAKKAAQADRAAAALAEERRRETSERLRESRDVLALAMRGGRMGAWSHDFSNGRVWWSRELEELFGLAPGAFAGTEQGFFDLVHADDRAQQRAIVDAAIREHRDFVSEYRFRHADGSWRRMEERGRAVYAADGTPVVLYGIAIDISERHASELRLRALNADLREGDRRRNEFLATLAHELRNPLAPIRNAVSMLQHPGCDAALHDFAVGMIDRQLALLTRLVDDLLDTARITRGKVELRKDRVPVRSIVEGAIEGVRTVIDGAGHTLEVDNCVADELVHLDPTRATQMLQNLLQNAAKYTPPGGRIHLRCARIEDALELSVRDNGIGITPAQMQQVFEMFAQVSPALERSQGGLGIGLALVRNLAELHGGSVDGYSAGLGQGSEFVIRLPIGVEDAACGTKDSRAAPAALPADDAVHAGDTAAPQS